MKISEIKKYCSICGSMYFNDKIKFCVDCQGLLTKVKSFTQSAGTQKPYILMLFGSDSK